MVHAVFTGDWHAGNENCEMFSLREELGKHASPQTDLYVLGDTFEGYFFKWETLVWQVWPLVEIMNLYRSVTVVGGNHDEDFRLFCQGNPGIFGWDWVYPSTIKTLYNGKRILLMHGHLLSRYWWVFRFLESFSDDVRFKKLARWVNRKWSPKQREKLSDDMAQRAFQLRMQTPDVDFVVCGHTHRACADMGSGYINAGTFLRAPNNSYRGQYVVLEDSGFRVITV